MKTKFTPAPLDAVDILARTIWGEARGDGVPGMQAVAAVILNRVHIAQNSGRAYWWGKDIITVCTKPYQFSCWNADDPNRAQLLAVTTQDNTFRQALQIARQALAGQLIDPTNGATHYHTLTIKPSWSENKLPNCLIKSHIFYDLS